MANLPNLLFVAGFTLNAGTTSIAVSGGRKRKVDYNPFCGAGLTVAQARIPLPAPGTPANPFPANGASGVGGGWHTPLAATWDISSNAQRYDVYFDTVNPPVVLVSSNQGGHQWALPVLAYTQTYYWRVRAKNDYNTTLGPVWSFTTAAETAPEIPHDPTPADTATFIARNDDLSWAVSLGATSYDVYFGTTATPPLVSAAQAGRTYDPGTMLYEQQYWWYIKANNAIGTTTGPLWTFTITLNPPPTTAPALVFTIAGVSALARVQESTILIRDVLNDAPNTCNFQLRGAPPIEGQSVFVKIGTLTIFGGTIESFDESFDSEPANLIWDVQCQDHMRMMNRRRPYGEFTNVSASTVIRQLVVDFSTDITTMAVQDGLDLISVSFNGEQNFAECLTTIKRIINANWWLDYLYDLHFFEGEEAIAPTDEPDAIDPFNLTMLKNPAIRQRKDLSQIRTRVSVKGHGENTTADVTVGETILPIEDSTMFNPAGGLAIAAGLRLTYTGTHPGGVGGQVGAPLSPPTAPTAGPWPGPSAGALASGVYQYAMTWVTALGETLPSPIATITVSTTPIAAPTFTGVFSLWSGATGAVLLANSDYKYVVTFIGPNGVETTPSPVSNTVTTGATSNSRAIRLDRAHAGVPSAPPGFDRQYYRTDGNGSTFYRMPFASDGFYDDLADWFNDHWCVDHNMGGSSPIQPTMNIQPPVVNTAIFTKVMLTNVQIGPPGVIARNIYRTDPNGSQLKLLGTIFNNGPVTNWLDANPSVIGANAPTVNTSGLVVLTGDVAAGSTTLPVTTLSPFNAAGGWAFVSQQLAIRYTGLSSTALTGIPALGPGSIQQPIHYSTAIDAAPALMGVTGITADILLGTKVNLFATVNDVPAQLELGLKERDSAGAATDGIHEYIIVDERIREDTAQLWAQADLGLFSRPIITITYYTRDPKTRSGKTVHVDMTSLGLSGDFIIQSVTIDQISISSGLWPQYRVEASSVRFSLEDVLRRLKLI